jgi:hypothetical protein
MTTKNNFVKELETERFWHLKRAKEHLEAIKAIQAVCKHDWKTIETYGTHTGRWTDQKCNLCLMERTIG